MRTVIIGNSGSGKTWLAKRYLIGSAIPIIHLDEIFWKPGGFDQKRSPSESDTLTKAYLQNHQWIVEGVFDSVAVPFLEVADCLIWLDISWEICSTRLKNRGFESKVHMDRAQSQTGLDGLIAWAEKYYTRSGPCSFSAHENLFLSFPRLRYRLKSQQEVEAYLNEHRPNWSFCPDPAVPGKPLHPVF